MSERRLDLALALVASLATACAERGGDDSATGRPTVTVGLPVAASTFLPLFLAQEEGLFEDEGVSVEIVTFRGGSDLVRAVVAGSVDMGVTSLAGVTVGISAEQPLKAFWAGYNFPVFDWYATPELTSIADVKGKRFGVTRYGSSTDFLTRYMLAANGLDPDRDVSIIQGGDSATRLAAMQAGQLDVNVFNPPETFVAEDRGYALLLRQRSLADDYPFHVFFSTESFIDDHRDVIESLLRAHVRAVRLAKGDRQRALTWLESRVGGEYAERTYDAFVHDIHEDGRLPSQEGLDIFFEMGVQAGRFESAWPLEKYWTPIFRDSMVSWMP